MGNRWQKHHNKPDAPPELAGQGNFVATISVSPAIMRSRNVTADQLQVALDAALQKLVNFDKTISVGVEQVEDAPDEPAAA